MVRRSSGVNGDQIGIYTRDLQEVMTQTFPGVPDSEITNVDRNAFRRALFAGLGDIVRFGQTLTGYRITESGRVQADFADGHPEFADLIIGADGVGSAVRQQLLPHASVADIGVRCLYGRMPITESTEGLIPTEFARGFCWISGGPGIGAGFGPQRYRSAPDGAADYLMTTFAATRERLGIPDDELFALSPERLWSVVTDAVADWHPVVREFFAHADPGSFFPITLRAGRRVDPWPSGPVTLLGDAIHTMPPTGGVGANTALRDAADLARELSSAGRGEQSLPAAVAAYERIMLPRGFATIDESLVMAERMFGTPAPQQ